MSAPSFLLIGCAAAGAFVLGIAVGAFWVRTTQVVLNRDIHVGFLKTLSERTARLDRLQRQTVTTQLCPKVKYCHPRPLRLWNSSEES
jgi:hypothetical protein